MTKTTETQNYIISVDKFLDNIYIQISTKDEFVDDVLDNILLFQKRGKNGNQLGRDVQD